MQRFHLCIRVYDLDANIEFYSRLFGASPKIRSAQHAQWLLNAPAVSFTVSACGHTPGLEQLGIHVDSDEELESVRMQFAKVDPCATEEPRPASPKARPYRHWLMDPQGILWEAARAAPQKFFGESQVSKAGR